MMSKEAKKNYVEEMKKNFTDNESVMIAQYQGLNVNELDSLRKELREKGILFKITKNRITKIALKETPKKDLEKYFTMTVKITDVEYKANTQKALLKFEVDGLPGKEGKWSFDIRGFETTRQLGDIQLGLLKKGSATYHGKITLPVSTMITKLSGGRTALSKMNAMKRKLFARSDPRVKRNLMSGRHGLSLIHI